MSGVLELKNFMVTRAGRAILESLSVSIPSGTITALAGPNGAGKSTLLRALSGLDPTAATLTPKGELRKLKDLDRRNAVTYLGSDLKTDFPLTARECIEVAFAREWSDEKTSRKLHIDSLLDRDVGSLSSGERQRIGFARALLQNPAAYCLDESFSQLDPEHLGAVRDLLTEKKSAGAAIVLVSHDWSFLSSLCDRWIFLREGKIIAEGETAEVLNEKNLRLLYPNAEPSFWTDAKSGRRRLHFL